jgi:hypothetical protein
VAFEAVRVRSELTGRLFLLKGVIMNCFVKLICVLLLLIATSAHAVEFKDGSRARDVLTNQVKMMFSKKQYAELDSMADKFRRNKSRFPDGVWKLTIFYTAFDLSSNTPEWAFPMYISKAEDWRHIRPKSITAQCVLANAWKDYAWQARGGGYASQVKEESWQLVRQRLEKAWKIVNERLAPGVSDCPNRLNLRLRLAQAMGFEKKKFETLFQEALQQEPGYYQHYTVKGCYLLPKWQGEEGDWQQFITRVAEQNPRGEGATIYTRTVWSMYLSNDWKDFQGSGVSWGRMKAGFKEIDHNYQNSPWILNSFARFACRAGDLETMKALCKQIDSGNYYPEAWGKDNAEDCRMWVKLGKSKVEIGREQFAEHNRQLQVRIFKELLELAEKGNRKVLGSLSNMYLRGDGTTVDPVAAYAWLLQDEAMYKEQLAISVKSLSSQQLQQARQKAEILRSEIAKQIK